MIINGVIVCLLLVISTVLIITLGSIHRISLHNKETQNIGIEFDEKTKEIDELKQELYKLHDELDKINDAFTPDNNLRWEHYEIWSKSLESFITDQAVTNKKNVNILERLDKDIQEILSNLKIIMSLLPYETPSKENSSNL